MKSKTSATAMVSSTMIIEALTRVLPVAAAGWFALLGSRALQQDGFENIGRVFRFVSRGLQDFEQFLQLDQVDGVFLFVKQLGDRFARYLVGHVFQAVHFDAVRHDVAAFFEQLYTFGQRGPLLDDKTSKFSRGFWRVRDLVDHQALASSV